ncbi:Tapetum determinant 1, putative isoform 2 [Theobroma cacao]|uniref:Tapetum determinant 1, putative isoform 2 n=1 Tax=Theobroma cacao TaxID=3641 RepID=A0A061GP93_THECC|nr:Tapetum determinant 1, putative isoform 2 [Theobroma cacao]
MIRALGSVDEKRLSMTFVAMLLALVLLFFVVESIQEEAVGHSSIKRMVFSKKNSSAVARKLLQSSGIWGGDANRIGTACTKDDIVILQGSTAPLPNGIPSYSVEIVNVCADLGCSISNIHVSCGWFSSVRLINPTVFRRLHYDDCLVNDGEALGPEQCLSFEYSNSFSYPLSVTSVTCC